MSELHVGHVIKEIVATEGVGNEKGKFQADNSFQTNTVSNHGTEAYPIPSSRDMKNKGRLIQLKDSLKDTLIIKPVPESLKNLFDKVINNTDQGNDYEIEIDGLLVDDTKTKTGKDFYDLFYNSWQAPHGAKNYTITASEKPFRLTSTQIVVSINDNPVYQGILQPRQDIVEAMSYEAILTTQSYLANYEEIMKQLNGDDMTGSGIF